MASRQPVLEPDLLWERNAVCYPCVIWDEKEDLFKMWYSAGDIEKPLAIGYAVSRDGEHWEKPYSEPVLKKDNSVLEKERVGACHVLRDGEQYVMFYTAWQDAFKPESVWPGLKMEFVGKTSQQSNHYRRSVWCMGCGSGVPSGGSASGEQVDLLLYRLCQKKSQNWCIDP